MVILKYSEAKLYLALFFLGACALFFLWLFFNPEAVADVRRARIFATDFGHYVLAPGLFLASLVPSLNFALIASGDLFALRATPDALRVRTFWRVRDIPWNQLLRIQVERVVQNKVVSFSLLFDVRGEGLGDTVRLNLHHTKAGEGDIPGLIETIELRQRQALAGGSAARPSGRSVADAPVEMPSATQARPAFGRKGL
jgi:hypothetical protein